MFVDSHGPNWLIAFTEGGGVAVRSGTEILRPNAPTAVFVPAFGLVEYHVNPGTLEWQAISSAVPLPPDMPHNTTLFSWDRRAPTNLADVIGLIRSRTDATTVVTERKASAVARRAKKYIDEHFTLDLKIASVADHLHCSRVVMSREFSATYGLSPVKYRHKLRIFEALRLMNQGTNITHALFRSGFSSPAEFIQQFKQVLSTTPGKYRSLAKSPRVAASTR